MTSPSDSPHASHLPAHATRRMGRKCGAEGDPGQTAPVAAQEPWGEPPASEDEEEPRSLYLRLRASRSRRFHSG